MEQNQIELGASYKFGGTDPEMFAVAAPIFKGPAPGDLPSIKGGPVLPAAYAANWTGFYLGGQAGYGWGDNHGAYNFSTPIGLISPIGVVGSGALTHDAQGVIFGAHAGYNRQFESDLVLGVEASVDGATLMRRENFGATNVNADGAALVSMVKSDIQGSLRGRAGYAFGRLLPYVTGGLAIGHFGTQSDFAAAAAGTPGDYDPATYIGFATHGLQWTTRLGWTVGGGAEWAVSDHWSIRGEYRYSEFGSVSDTPNVALPATLYGGARRLDQGQVQFGASYKFGDPLLVPVAAPVLAAKAPPIDWTGYTWAGLYAGGQVGMIWGANNGNYDIATPGGLGANDSLNGDAQVASVEGHVGYNWQYDHAVVGLEGSLLGTNLVKSSLLPVYDGAGLLNPGNPPNGGTLTTAVKSNLQGSLRGRLGYAWDRLLPFVTGGVALGGFTQQSYLWGGDSQGLFNASSSRSSLRAGWTLGAGAEWAMTRSWAIRGEYRYTDFGTVGDASTYAAPVATLFTGTHRLDQNLLEFGVSYKFGEEGQAPLVVAADLPHLKDAPVGCAPAGIALARLLRRRERRRRHRRGERARAELDLLGSEPAVWFRCEPERRLYADGRERLWKRRSRRRSGRLQLSDGPGPHRRRGGHCGNERHGRRKTKRRALRLALLGRRALARGAAQHGAGEPALCRHATRPRRLSRDADAAAAHHCRLRLRRRRRLGDRQHARRLDGRRRRGMDVRAKLVGEARISLRRHQRRRDLGRLERKL